MRPVFSYKSFDQQESDQDEVRKHWIDMRFHARSLGLQVLEQFEDSADEADPFKRVGFSRMLAATKDSGVRTLFFWDLDDLACSTLMQEITVFKLQNRGIEVIEVHPERKGLTLRTFKSMLLSELQQHRLNQLADGRKRVRQLTGRCEGRKPYGYFPDEAPVITRMRELRDKGLTWAAIATTLNNDGQRTRSKSLWCANSIRRIVMGCR